MNHYEDILENYKNGLININDAMKDLKTMPYKDLGFARIDHHRTLRQGFPEVIFCPGKEKEEIVEIILELIENNPLVLATRARTSVADYILQEIPDSFYHKKARIISFGKFPDVQTNNYALVISAGTSDFPVAEEAIITLKANGVRVETLFDCGVAGSHRIFGEINKIQNASAIIVVAGMEGALASFIGGLSSCPVIAVPTSIGYGASFGGVAALLSMLNSCASCVSTVNIDNGFSAACIASMTVKQSKDL